MIPVARELGTPASAPTTGPLDSTTYASSPARASRSVAVQSGREGAPTLQLGFWYVKLFVEGALIVSGRSAANL
jgi:hypothetical protein